MQFLLALGVRYLREANELDSQQSRAAAYGIFPMAARLDQIVSSLNAAGFETSSICVFLPPTHPVAGEVRSIKSSAGELSGEGGYERVVAWLATLGGVVVPDVGFFVGARGYLRAVACGLCRPGDGRSGALAYLGIPADAAARYEARTREDASLVFVSCDGWAQSEWAREILRLLRAEEVCAIGEQSEDDCDLPPAGSGMVMLEES
jgi:hypothetical protein